MSGEVNSLSSQSSSSVGRAGSRGKIKLVQEQQFPQDKQNAMPGTPMGLRKVETIGLISKITTRLENWRTISTMTNTGFWDAVFALAGLFTKKVTANVRKTVTNLIDRVLQDELKGKTLSEDAMRKTVKNLTKLALNGNLNKLYATDSENPPYVQEIRRELKIQMTCKDLKEELKKRLKTKQNVSSVNEMIATKYPERLEECRNYLFDSPLRESWVDNNVKQLITLILERDMPKISFKEGDLDNMVKNLADKISFYELEKCAGDNVDIAQITKEYLMNYIQNSSKKL